MRLLVLADNMLIMGSLIARGLMHIILRVKHPETLAIVEAIGMRAGSFLQLDTRGLPLVRCRGLAAVITADNDRHHWKWRDLLVLTSLSSVCVISCAFGPGTGLGVGGSTAASLGALLSHFRSELRLFSGIAIINGTLRSLNRFILLSIWHVEGDRSDPTLGDRSGHPIGVIRTFSWLASKAVPCQGHPGHGLLHVGDLAY